MRSPSIWAGAAALAASAVAALVAVPQEPGQRPVFRGGANLVLVDAYPRKDGRIVEGLTPTDFEIAEDGVPQKVDQFEFVRVSPALDPDRRDPNNQREMLQQAADPHNRVFVIFLDKYNVDVFGSHYSRKPIVEMLNKMIGPNDLFGVTTANTRVADLVLQRNSHSIETQLSARWDWGEENRSGNDPEDPFENFLDGCCACDARELKARRREHKALTAMRDLVTYLSRIREARTSLIVFSGGWRQYMPVPQGMAKQTPTITTRNGRLGVNDPPDNLASNRHACVEAQNEIVMYDHQRLFRDLIDQAVRSNVVFYTIDPGGLRPPQMASSAAGMEQLHEMQTRRLDSLMELARNTDGLPIVNTNDLMGGADRIVNDVSAYYLLGYYSTNLKRDGRLRRIKVTLKRDDIEVVARRWYVAENAAAIAKAEAEARTTASPAVADGVMDGVKTALGPLARIDANTSEMFVSATRGRSEIVVVAEVSATEMGAAGGTWNRGVTVEATAVNRAGDKLGSATGAVDAGKRSVLLRIPLEAANGASRVTVTSRGQGATTANQVDVLGTLDDLVGAPIVFRGTASAQSALVPVADLLFRRTERAHIEWPVKGALDRREARLLDRRGQPLPIAVNLTERDATAGPSVVADVLLSALAAGDYVIELTAAAGADTTRRYVALRVAR